MVNSNIDTSVFTNGEYQEEKCPPLFHRKTGEPQTLS